MQTSFRDARPVADERAILEDPEVRLVIGAGILDERAPMAVRAMRHGKDVMLDKPGATSLDQLAALRRVQAETGRILSILYSEHYTQPSTVAAGELVRTGAIGRVIQTVGLGPHRIGNYARPDWFWSRERTGGILCDIASHQVEQFLFFTGATAAQVASSQIANFDHPERPEFDDFGQMVLVSDLPRASSASTGSRPTACRCGGTGGCSSSAPRGRSSSGSTWTWQAAPAATTCSSSTGRGSAMSNVPGPR